MDDALGVNLIFTQNYDFTLIPNSIQHFLDSVLSIKPIGQLYDESAVFGLHPTQVIDLIRISGKVVVSIYNKEIRNRFKTPL